MQLVFGSIAVVALAGVAVAYFAQKQGSAPSPPPIAQPTTDKGKEKEKETAQPQTPPPAQTESLKFTEEAIARSRT